MIHPVSGANRGLGFGFVEALAKRTGTIVFAGTRDPSNAATLQELATKNPNIVHIVKLTSGEIEDNKAAAAEIEKIAGRLDVVIANAGESAFRHQFLCFTHEFSPLLIPQRSGTTLAHLCRHPLSNLQDISM